jgi:hypothetical protein
LGGSDLGINLGVLIIAGIVSVVVAGSRRLLKGPIESVGRAFAVTRVGVDLVDFLCRNSSGEGSYVSQISRHDCLSNYLL